MLRQILAIFFLLFLVWYGGKYFHYHIPYLSDISLPIPKIKLPTLDDLLTTKSLSSPSPSPSVEVSVTPDSSVSGVPVSFPNSVPVSTTVTPVPIPASVTAVQNLLAKKYQRAVSVVLVKLKMATDKYASGTVAYNIGETSEDGGWLAAKVDREWVLVYDGHGVVSCAALEPYNFPHNMVTKCIGANGKTVDRTLEASVKLAPG